MRAAAADRKAGRDLERLYASHKRDVYRSVLRDVRDPDEAEDITQTAFLDAFRALRRGDEPQQPHAWLLTIARNVARRRFRGRAARPAEIELDPELLAAPDREGPSADDIRVALERLRPAQREALVLREIGGRSYGEIAAAMDMSVPAVETLLFRARRALRAELEDEAARTRGRALGGLLPFPGPGWDGLGSLAGWLTGRGATMKVAGAVSAAVLGTGVGIQQGLVPQGDTGAAEAAAPVESEAPALAAGRQGSEAATRPAAGLPKKEAPGEEKPKPAAAREGAATAGDVSAAADRLTSELTRRVAETRREVDRTVEQVTTDLARRTAEVRREVESTAAQLEATAQRATGYIRKIPKVVSGMGALSAAEIPSAITLRVSAGSTMPSSQRRAVE